MRRVRDNGRGRDGVLLNSFLASAWRGWPSSLSLTARIALSNGRRDDRLGVCQQNYVLSAPLLVESTHCGVLLKNTIFRDVVCLRTLSAPSIKLRDPLAFCHSNSSPLRRNRRGCALNFCSRRSSKDHWTHSASHVCSITHCTTRTVGSLTIYRTKCLGLDVCLGRVTASSTEIPATLCGPC